MKVKLKLCSCVFREQRLQIFHNARIIRVSNVMMALRTLCNYEIDVDVFSRDADEIQFFCCCLKRKEIRIVFLIFI
jgi:hypothetical protein